MPRRASGESDRSRRVVRIDTSDAQDEPISPEAAERFERLRNLRLQLARERQLPPYCICHDSTLKLIAKSAPASIAALVMSSESLTAVSTITARGRGSAAPTSVLMWSRMPVALA